MSFLDNTGVTRLVTDLKSRFAAITHNHAASDITSGTLPIARGGTGASTHTSNAVLTGNGTSAVNNVATADGALYATAANGAAQFGTLPIAQGGTGATTAAGAVENVVDGQALAPASVAATGEVSAKSGTTTHKLTEKAEDTRADNLEASIAPVESVTATSNHAAGDYFMLGDVLMKATAAIATGEQITTSNATPATVQAQIDALRDSVSIPFTNSFGTGVSGNGVESAVRLGSLVFVKINITVSTTSWVNVATGLPTPTALLSAVSTSFSAGDGKTVKISMGGDILTTRALDSGSHNIDALYVYPCS